jgi:accessory gene regulator B
LINTIWENHIDKFVQIILKKLETTDCEKRVFMRVEYSLRVIISEMEKLFLLGLIFALIKQFNQFLVSIAVLIIIRIFVGGTHQKNIFYCFVQTLINLLVIIGISKFLISGYWCSVFVLFSILVVAVAPVQSSNRITYDRKQKMRFKVKALLVIVVLVYSKYVVDKLKKTLNNALSNFAQKIQVNTGSFLVWGEIKLPEEIRKEIEYKNINKEWQ